MKKISKKLAHVLYVPCLATLACGIPLGACDALRQSMDQEPTPRQEEVEEAEKAQLLSEVHKQILEQVREHIDSGDFKSDTQKFIEQEVQKSSIRLNQVLSQLPSMSTQSEREPILFINTGPSVFQPPSILSRNDVYSYDCRTRKITFRDGTSGYYPEALDKKRDAR